VTRDREAVCAAAREHLGLAYLWGGTSSYGLDCSGLVHHSYRRAGVVVPRDAHDQYTAATPVCLGEEQPGDLYFFAREDGHVVHVGFVTGERTILHAPETGRFVEEVPLTPERLATLYTAARFLT
jgi:cell wall-associated NlpC family hydrolase